jgi:hypothetical protein
VALVLWCFCPNILGNGALITPDVPAAALGVTACYFFWRWLKACDNRFGLAQSTANSSPLPLDGGGVGGGGDFARYTENTPPGTSPDANSTPAALTEYHTPMPPSTWPATLLAGLTLGLAELTKSTWIILFVLYPAMWLVWTLCRGPSAAAANDHSTDVPRSLVQLATILGHAVYILNLGYGFENSFQPLGKFAFISKTLGGPDAHEKPGNRFSDTWLAGVPVPVPANYLRGIDVQKYDFEKGKWSYLRGEQKFGGWWYYYLYAMAVKMPVGMLALIGLAFVSRLPGFVRWAAADSPRRFAPRRSAIIVLTPAVVVLVLISSQTGFSRYLRYALPAFPFLFVFASSLATTGPSRFKGEPGGNGSERSIVPATSNPRNVPERARRADRAPAAAAIPILLVASAISSLAVFPHSLSYFNEVAGGPLRGAEHLLDANIDWGQDLLFTRIAASTLDTPLQMSHFGFINPQLADISPAPDPRTSVATRDANQSRSGNGVANFAISLNKLHGYRHFGETTDHYRQLRDSTPVGRVGYSILLFSLSKPAK